MPYKKNIAIASALVLLALVLPQAQAGVYVIADSRVRSLDVSPTLGKGYSVMTNSFQSTCVTVEETTIPSFNYDYSYYDFSGSEDVETSIAQKMSGSFSYAGIQSKYSDSTNSQENTATKTYVTIGYMRIERYYNSMREEVSPLNESALTLLDNQDYVGFFKACGPNYVRGLRRAQEVTAYFSLTSTSTEKVSDFTSNLQTTGWSEGEGNMAESSKFASVTSNMKITISAYGLGLTLGGSETLVANSLEDYDAVMKFAWKSMVSSPDAAHVGMVFGMEIVPWVNNVAFQVAAGAGVEPVEAPLPRSLIPQAYLMVANAAITGFDNAQRNLFRCKQPGLEMDMYGYCCEIAALYDPEEKEYDGNNPEARTCKPVRQLDSALVTENMSGNGEFVARLDRALRYKINQLNTLDKCIAAINAIPTRMDYHILRTIDTVRSDSNSSSVNNVTVFEMRNALDPFKDYQTVKSTAAELDEFIEMFYAPCLAAIFGANIGNTPGTDVTYFMAYPWYSHSACTKLSCFGSGMRWDRSSAAGGCVAGIMAGPTATPYGSDAASDAGCKKDIDSVGSTQVCKHSSAALREAQEKLMQCNEGSSSVGRIDVFLSNYCLPQLSGLVLTDEAEIELRESSAQKCTELVENTLNVALKRPTSQASTGWRGPASLAVDGRSDGYYWRRSVTHTHWASGSGNWWEVNLQQEHTINEIKVFFRSDCCMFRNNGLVVKLLAADNTVVWESNPYVVTNEKMSLYEVPVDSSGDRRVGSKVRIEAGTSGYLSLAEVEVWNIFYTVNHSE